MSSGVGVNASVKYRECQLERYGTLGINHCLLEVIVDKCPKCGEPHKYFLFVGFFVRLSILSMINPMIRNLDMRLTKDSDVFIRGVILELKCPNKNENFNMRISFRAPAIYIRIFS